MGFCIRIISITCFRINDSIKLRYNNLRNSIIDSEIVQIIIPKNLSKIIVFIEDRRFFYHLGVDIYSIFRAIFRLVFDNKIEGASTITQQLVRTITNDRELTIRRKIREIILASLIEREFSKEKILRAYFIKYNFSHSIGIHRFCLKEGYDINCLNIQEIFEIVARLKYPSINAKNYTKFLKRVRTIDVLVTKNNPLFEDNDKNYKRELLSEYSGV